MWRKPLSASAPAGGARWSYKGLRLSLRNLPPSALAGSIQYRNAATALAALEALEAMLPTIAATPGRQLSAVLREPLALSEHTVSVALRERQFARSFPDRARGLGRVDSGHRAQRARRRDLCRSRAGAAHRGSDVRRSGNSWRQGCGRHRPAGRAGGGSLDFVRHPGAAGHFRRGSCEKVSLPDSRTTLAASVEAGCEVARATAKPGDRVLVFGSFHTVGPALQWLGPRRVSYTRDRSAPTLE